MFTVTAFIFVKRLFILLFSGIRSFGKKEKVQENEAAPSIGKYVKKILMENNINRQNNSIIEHKSSAAI